MFYYFQLQFRMISRNLVEFGINPVIGSLLAVFVFTGMSFYLFHVTEYADYIYSVVSILLISNLSQTVRTEALKMIFSKKDFYKIRLLENMLVIFPFGLIIALQNEPKILIFLILSAILLIFLNFNNKLNFTIPTPFTRWPFEFIVGFRYSIGLILLSWFFTFMSVSVGNYNLGIFSLLLIFTIGSSYYMKPETNYFVWIFAFDAKHFLIQKIKIAILCISMLSIPVFIILVIFFPENYLNSLAFLLIGYIIITSLILAKYSSFPGQINFPQMLLLGICVWFPPLIIAVLPYFYFKSINNLNEILK